MDLKALAVEVAKLGLPLLGAALPVPGGAAVGAALASHIGAPSSTPSDLLTALQSSVDAVQKAKEFEANHQEHLLQLASDAEKAANQNEVDDRASAREMRVKTGSTMPEQLTYAYTGAFFVIMGGILGGWLSLPAEPHAFTVAVMGITLIVREVTQTTAYWVSSTFTSKFKDETINNLSAGGE